MRLVISNGIDKPCREDTTKGASAEVRKGCIPTDLGGRNKIRTTVADMRSAIREHYPVLFFGSRSHRLYFFISASEGPAENSRKANDSLVSLLKPFINKSEEEKNGKDTDNI